MPNLLLTNISLFRPQNTFVKIKIVGICFIGRLAFLYTCAVEIQIHSTNRFTNELVTYFVNKLLWRSQDAEKVTHTKGNQAVILFICVPFQNGNFF